MKQELRPGDSAPGSVPEPALSSKLNIFLLVAAVASVSLLMGGMIGAKEAVTSHKSKAASELRVGSSGPAPGTEGGSQYKAMGGTGYCWACDADNTESRDSWWFGWGACICKEGWKGDCCSEPKVDIDTQWLRYLENSPDEVKVISADLASLADEKVGVVNQNSLAWPLANVDIVVSGGGNLDAFWMGASMVLSRVASVGVKRYAGRNIRDYKDWFSNAASAAWYQDHHWRLMADWQTDKYSVSSLDEKVVLGTTCLKPFPELVKISKFTKETAASAFMSTGTFFEMYDGWVCSDGGATSGKKMTPLFQDDVRPQVIVDLMSTGFPTSMVYDAELEQYVRLIKVGMDEMVKFLTTGVTERNDIISYCPTGSDVSENICLQYV
ncbi:hypothetical protein TrST_g13632 [Triparma strigata]|uniref:Uncharacterized protein n=1 Tax=Triparma strigata TaxID=1606541 RepID=A0A9W7C5T0_9STRA|nr:hypothetical protein TrST_g13632 [Triparma strigata]